MTALTAVPAMAQVATWPPATAYGQPGVTTGDIHRYEMERLRDQADRNQALAQSQALSTQLQIQSLQAARSTPLVLPENDRVPTVEEARQRRDASSARARTQGQTTGQIDAWLDRRPQ